MNIDLKRKKRLLLLLVGLFLFVGLMYLGFLQYKISDYQHQNAPKHADYLIILGARVKGTTPSLALKYRINAAIKYLKDNNQTFVIASGGRGSGETISEAEAIKRGLVKKGISLSRIVLEDCSTNTYDNIRFSKKLLPRKAEHGIIVTNDFHVYRATMIAKDQGLHVVAIPAKTPSVVIIKSYVREYAAITKYYLDKILHIH